jgi:hypothetical protein
MSQVKVLMGRIYVEAKRGGAVWVPYKTLIGYGIGNRVIVGSRGVQVHMSQEFESHQAAVDAAKARATEIIKGKYGDASNVSWDVVEERVPHSFAVKP